MTVCPSCDHDSETSYRCDECGHDLVDDDRRDRLCFSEADGMVDCDERDVGCVIHEEVGF